MPIYEYKCKRCGVLSEILVGLAQGKEEVKCFNCGSSDLEKILWSKFMVGKSTAPDMDGCCGQIRPCDNPKRCCGK
ncbi:MAG: zinc ribbon domain-containing protein [Actinomycetota bacterium]|nr:zinc ribbon domain-containing protein [Actinomycetota bacterium]MDI6821749.1 zinc ribbon domain-containing protein [Actinomycetota bacterium]